MFSSAVVNSLAHRMGEGRVRAHSSVRAALTFILSLLRRARKI
jgi:hypothetical protein